MGTGSKTGSVNTAEFQILGGETYIAAAGASENYIPRQGI